MASLNSEIDKQAETLAKQAKSRCKGTQKNPADTFVLLTKPLRKDTDSKGRTPLTAEWMFAADDEAREGGVQKEHMRCVRFDLEEALLRLDSSVLHGKKPPRWPSLQELEDLNNRIAKMARVTGKRLPRSVWRQCEKLDRSFPRLKSCRRIAGFLRRLLETEPRPLGRVIQSKAHADTKLAEEFFKVVESVRTGKACATKVDWLHYEQLLLVARSNRPRRTKQPRNRLWPEDHTKGTPDSVLAYIAFLELDRDDLLWGARHWRKLWEAGRWASRLGNSDLAKQFRPFIPGTGDWVEACDKVGNAAARVDARIRQQRHRIKKRQFV